MPSYEDQSGASAPPGFAGTDDNDDLGGNNFGYQNNNENYGEYFNVGRAPQYGDVTDFVTGETYRARGSMYNGGGGPNDPTPAPPPNQWLDPEKPKHEALPMGGARTGTYETQQPNFADLTAKHQTGFNNSSTGETEISDMFNFNGTVYHYNPESESYTDTYTGNKITQDNGQTGSLGIAGIYGGGNAQSYQQDLSGIAAVNTTPQGQQLNPAYTEWLANQTNDGWGEGGENIVSQTGEPRPVFDQQTYSSNPYGPQDDLAQQQAREAYNYDAATWREEAQTSETVSTTGEVRPVFDQRKYSSNPYGAQDDLAKEEAHRAWLKDVSRWESQQ